MPIPYQSSYDETIAFSDTCEQFALATDTALTYTIPGTLHHKYNMLLGLNITNNVFVGYNVTAAYPGAGAQTATPNLELNPRQKRYVKGGDVISLITPDAEAYVSISLRTIPN